MLSVRETRNILSTRMNGHLYSTVTSQFAPSIMIHFISHQHPFIPVGIFMCFKTYPLTPIKSADPFSQTVYVCILLTNKEFHWALSCVEVFECVYNFSRDNLTLHW